MIDTKAIFATAWEAEVESRKKQSPNFTLADYTVTGRAPAKYGGKRTAEWWADNGPVMVDNWIEWRKRTRWALWETPDGKPGIELELNVTLPGDIPVKMFIDRMFVTGTGEIVVVDLKSGRLPETEEQLGFYATGIELTWGKQYRPAWGYYWDAQKGDHGKPLSLDKWTPGLFAQMYKEAAAGINAGCFLPKPANACANWCGVARYCTVVGGVDALGVDSLAVL